jgi:hypothetical protein
MVHEIDTAAIANIWFVCWAIRRKGDLDHKLDTTAKVIRWSFAYSLMALASWYPTIIANTYLRAGTFFAGVAFLVWPNCAYNLTQLLRRVRILRDKPPDPPEDESLTLIR